MKTESYDVAVLGAGFSGLWTSIYLKEKNINHVVISANASNIDSEAKFGIKEKVDKDVFHAASRLNCGLFMPSGPFDSKDSEFLQETYKQLIIREDLLDMQHTGVLEVATNKEEFEFGKRLFEKANADQREKWLRLMTKEEIKAEEPNLETEGGLLFTQAGTVNPSKLLNQLETEVENIKYNFQIIDLKISDDNVTIFGSEIVVKAKKIILALGVGCSDFTEKHLGRKVNGLRAVRGTMWSTKDTKCLPRLKWAMCGLQSGLFYSKKPLGLLPKTTNSHGADPKINHLYCQVTSDGSFICGGEREEVDKDFNTVRKGAVEGNRQFISSIYPALVNTRIDSIWSGIMPWTIDGNPIIGNLEKNVWINTGLCSSGLMRSAGAGKYVAELIEDDLNGNEFTVEPYCDPRRFLKP